MSHHTASLSGLIQQGHSQTGRIVLICGVESVCSAKIPPPRFTTTCIIGRALHPSHHVTHAAATTRLVRGKDGKMVRAAVSSLRAFPHWHLQRSTSAVRRQHGRPETRAAASSPPGTASRHRSDHRPHLAMVNRSWRFRAAEPCSTIRPGGAGSAGRVSSQGHASHLGGMVSDRGAGSSGHLTLRAQATASSANCHYANRFGLGELAGCWCLPCLGWWLHVLFRLQHSATPLQLGALTAAIVNGGITTCTLPTPAEAVISSPHVKRVFDIAIYL